MSSRSVLRYTQDLLSPHGPAGRRMARRQDGLRLSGGAEEIGAVDSAGTSQRRARGVVTDRAVGDAYVVLMAVPHAP
jgi:hypothetical protein